MCPDDRQPSHHPQVLFTNSRSGGTTFLVGCLISCVRKVSFIHFRNHMDSFASTVLYFQQTSPPCLVPLADPHTYYAKVPWKVGWLQSRWASRARQKLVTIAFSPLSQPGVDRIGNALHHASRLPVRPISGKVRWYSSSLSHSHTPWYFSTSQQCSWPCL